MFTEIKKLAEKDDDLGKRLKEAANLRKVIRELYLAKSSLKSNEFDLRVSKEQFNKFIKEISKEMMPTDSEIAELFLFWGKKLTGQMPQADDSLGKKKPEQMRNRAF